MENGNKTLIRIPLINIWYVVLSLIFILMQVTHIIDWSPIWLLCPLWLPFAAAILLVMIPYIGLGLLWVIDNIYNIFRRKR